MNFIIKIIKGIINFWVSSAALVVLYFCDLCAIGLALSLQSRIPVIAKAAKTHGIIEYVLPALAVFAVSLVFVKINKKHFHLTLAKIILRYIGLAVLLVGSVVLIGYLCAFLWSLIPEDTKDLLISILGTPFLFLTVISHGTVFFLLIPLVLGALALCVIVPLSLIAGFAAASFYEKRSRFFKILLKLAALVSLVLFVKYLVQVGTTITDEDIFSRNYYTEKDARFLEKLHKEGFDFDGKKMLPYLVQHGSPDFIIKQVISYGVDFRKYSEDYFRYGMSYERVRQLLEMGADPNVKKSDEWPLLFWVLEDYDTLKLTLEKGADVNVKYETQISVYEDG
nr:hypothetical protein [Treponema sp.]